MKALLLFFVLCSGTLHAKELSFDSLAEAAYPQEVTVCGFLYRTQSGDLVLAAEPNLKSCCVGGRHTVEKQIYVEGDIESLKAGQVYLLQGIFTVDPFKDSAGHLTRLYQLRNARVLLAQEKASMAIWFAVIILIALFYFVYRKFSFLK